jgi:hypothetical protein
MKQLIQLPEPKLLFRYDQALEDPRDGLTLFGPLDSGQIYGIRSGVVGTEAGIERFKRWGQSIQGPIISATTDSESLYRPFFPGFQTVFGVRWSPTPQIEIPIDPDELAKRIRIGNSHQRVFRTVSLFADAIIEAKRKEDVQVDVWFVIVREDVEKYCRPLSTVESSIRVEVDSIVSESEAKEFLTEPPLYPDMVEAQPFYYEPDFHNQLKARLLLKEAPIQIIRETTIAPQDFLKANGFPVRKVDKPSVIAWNICATAFYKASGRPWKLARVRPGVCYLGLVFKRDERSVDSTNACCAAQMFLDSGDGVVFKGAIGPWYSPTSKEFHLNSEAASEVVKTAVETYKAKNSTKRAPKELFIHGRIGFSDEEWNGFKSAVDRTTKLIGVQIKRRGDLKVYSNLEYPMLRGMAHILNERQAYLWTIGFVPRMQTFLGKEVPNPLFINVCRGRIPIEQILKDILALTKLNYNACQYGDGSPVTLKFADAVGEILTAGPVQPNSSPLPFKFYI